MQQLTLAAVRQQIEDHRKTRKNRRQPFPEEILENIRQLCKTTPIAKLQQELKLSESTVGKFRKPRTKARAGVMRVAPVTLVSSSSALSVEISLHDGQTMNVHGLGGLPDVAALLRALREA